MDNNLRTLSFFLGLLIFIPFFYLFWKTLCIDWSRHFMFEERAKLFRLAISGHLSFESAAYRETRLRIERHIRYLHALTWPRLILSEILRRRLYLSHDIARRKRFAEILASVEDPVAQKELYAIGLRTGFAALVCLMGRSIILGPLFLLLYFCGILTWRKSPPPAKTFYTTVNRNAECFEEAHSEYVKAPIRQRVFANSH